MRKLLPLCLVFAVGCTGRDNTQDREIAALKEQVAALSGRPSLGAVQSKLSPETAREILIKELFADDEDRKKPCGLRGLSRLADKKWAFDAADQRRVACVKSLADAGLADFGPCVEWVGGRCWKAAIEAKGGAWLKDDFLGFFCADVGLPTVKSVMTDGNKATVVYQRTATFNEKLMNKLTDCVLDKPKDIGDLDKTWAFARDDAGKWRITGQIGE